MTMRWRSSDELRRYPAEQDMDQPKDCGVREVHGTQHQRRLHLNSRRDLADAESRGQAGQLSFGKNCSKWGIFSHMWHMRRA